MWGGVVEEVCEDVVERTGGAEAFGGRAEQLDEFVQQEPHRGPLDHPAADLVGRRTRRVPRRRIGTVLLDAPAVDGELTLDLALTAEGIESANHYRTVLAPLLGTGR